MTMFDKSTGVGLPNRRLFKYVQKCEVHILVFESIYKYEVHILDF